ncbi:MAG: zf-HC2 domain-containing protein [Clostridiales bacterium]|jgi:hypothetical protein|nr:zf-HC2 domain-containing protein [Clostridiales bacterium]
MECEKADILMMKYMDKTITEREAKMLNKHILSCAKCKESFIIYDSIASDLGGVPVEEAPAGFTSRVMSAVAALPAYTGEGTTRVMYGVWGVVGFFAVIGALLIFLRDIILQAIDTNPIFEPIMPSVTYVAQSVDMLYMQASAVTSVALEAVSEGMTWVLPVVIVCLIAVLIVIYRSERSRKGHNK